MQHDIRKMTFVQVKIKIRLMKNKYDYQKSKVTSYLLLVHLLYLAYL